MAKLTVKTGSTSRLEHVFILDSASTTGAGKTALTNASVTMHYFRPGDSTPTAVTLSAGTLATWTSGGFVKVQDTDMPGVYEVGIPNAVFAAGANHAIVMIKGTGIAPVVLEYDLVAYDPLDGVRLGLTALPNAACSSNASLITSGTGTAQLSVSSGTVTTGAISNGAITNAAITANAIADDVWGALVTRYTTNTTLGYRVLRSDATSHSGDVQVSGNGTANNHNRIDSDVHAIASDATAGTNLKSVLLNTSTVTLGAQFNSTGNTAVATQVFTTDITGSTNPSSGYWLYQAGLNSQSIVSDTNTMVQTAYIESIADTLLGRNIAGSSNTGRLVKEALYALRNKTEIVGNQLNVYNNVDSAVAWTASVASSAGANPVTGIDPA